MSTSCMCMATPGCCTLAWSGRTVMGQRLVKKIAKIVFFRTGLPEVPEGRLGATVEFFQSVWTVGKPKVSTF